MWISGSDVLPAKSASPEYTAVMLCTPSASEDVDSVAEPAVRGTGEPKFPTPSRNCTCPVGVPGPDAGETVAVSVTVSPKVDGFGDEDTVVTDAAAPQLLSRIVMLSEPSVTAR